MEKIELLRAKLDRSYRPWLYRVIGAILVCYACYATLQTSMLPPLTILVFAGLEALIFYFRPNAALMLQICALFISFAHINCFALVVSIALAFFFFSDIHFCILSAIVLPLTMIPGNIFYGWYFVVFLFGLCLISKSQGAIIGIFWGLYFFSIALMTGSLGLRRFYHGFRCIPVAFTDADSYVNSLDLDTGFEIFKQCDFTLLFICIAVVAAVSIFAFLIFVRSKIGVKQLAFDVLEAIHFVIMTAILGVAVWACPHILKYSFEVPYATLLIQGLIAYIITRPFSSDAVIQVIGQSKGPSKMMDGGTGAIVSNASVSFSKWDDIAGYDETKREIRDAIRPYTDKREYTRLTRAGMKPVRGMLLFGPPGTGKTTFAKIIANETKMKLIIVNAGSFVSKYVGESEQNLTNIFSQARMKAPCIICFDEIEAFLLDRSKISAGYEMSLISTFLTQMDGFVDSQNVFIIATTNNPSMIDAAALRPGRFDKLIYVGPPDKEGRQAIFAHYLKGKGHENIDVHKLAEASERFTGADIKALCEAAYMDNDFKPVSEEQLLARISITRPTFTLEMKKGYELWSGKYGRSSFAQEDNKVKETKKYTWDDIKGMDQVKAILRETIEDPIKNAEKYKEYDIPAAKGILLFGPPGCGKTFFAKVVADESDASFFTVNGPELLGGATGESEENLRKLFMNAREAKPAIVFFDEIDAIASARDNSGGSVKLVNQLLTEMDGMENLSGVTVIAATNRPDALDPALLRAGRFDTKVYISLPDEYSVHQLAVSTLGNVPCNADMDTIAKALDGYTCADVVAVMNKAKVIYVKRSIKNPEAEGLTTEDILSVISGFKSSVSTEEAATYEKQKSLESY